MDAEKKAYGAYDVTMDDGTVYHLTDVVMSHDPEALADSFYDRDGVMVLSVGIGSLVSILRTDVSTREDKPSGSKNDVGCADSAWLIPLLLQFFASDFSVHDVSAIKAALEADVRRKAQKW